MPQVMVMSRQDAKAYSYRNHAKTSVIVSITDVEAPFNRFSSRYNNGIKAILPVKFNDVDVGQELCITRKDADKIADFINKWKDNVDLIVVHCEAGISRSAGVAAAVLKYLDNDDFQIFKSGYCRPNMSCYRMVLQALTDIEDKKDNLKNTNLL